LDQAVFDGETVANAFIPKNGPVSIAHNLMHFDQDSPGTFWMKGNRLDMRIDLGLLLRPVSPDLIVTTNDTAFKRTRPFHIGCHGGECGVEIPRVERGIGRAQEFDFRRTLI
jgi:hypothetical protein